jgi:hypothetical protein
MIVRFGCSILAGVVLLNSCQVGGRIAGFLKIISSQVAQGSVF